jgi:hypothetical protein
MRAVYDSQDAIPEALREEYVEQGGKWVLNLEGADSHPVVTGVVAEANKKVGEFRDNNIGLNQKVETASSELATWNALGVTPDQVKADRARLAELEQKGVKKGDDITTQIRAAVTAAVGPLNERLEATEAARQEAEQNALSQLTDTTLTKAGVAAGVAETALGDFLARGKSLFQNQGGTLVAVKDGTPVYSSKRPGQPLTVEEWANDLQAEAPHLYKPNVGGGATGGTGSAAPVNKRTITANEMSDNLEAVAKGEVIVLD